MDAVANLLDVVLLRLLVRLIVGVLEAWLVFVWVRGQETLDGEENRFQSLS